MVGAPCGRTTWPSVRHLSEDPSRTRRGGHYTVACGRTQAPASRLRAPPPRAAA